MSIPIGKPIIVYPYRCKGCLERLLAPFLWIIPRLVIFGLGVAAGYVWGVVGG